MERHRVVCISIVVVYSLGKCVFYFELIKRKEILFPSFDEGENNDAIIKTLASSQTGTVEVS